jgi:putative transposase
MVRVNDLISFTELSDNSEPDITKIVSHSFQKMFQSYAMAFNKKYERVGTLFQKPFKRSLVESEEYFTNLILYIHSNPQKHGYVKDFRTYKWSSYLPILNNSSNMLLASEVIDWFGGKTQYFEQHADRQINVFTGGWDND